MRILDAQDLIPLNRQTIAMDEKILDHYLQFSTFTNVGCYKTLFQGLPNDIKGLGTLIRGQIVHRETLKEGNTKTNTDLRYGDMSTYPWYRLRSEDDVLPTAVAMTAELLRYDDRGFIEDRKVEHKIIVTCRYVSVLMASILKSKGIPCRVRSGFAPYLYSEGSWDHWINQYWDFHKHQWITFDVDQIFDSNIDFDDYNTLAKTFNWAADTWIGIREGRLNPDLILNAEGSRGLMPALWAIFYDFHSLMNNEILYNQMPRYVHYKFDDLSEADFIEIDELAKLMLDPDKNFDKLIELWNTKKKFRILNTSVVGDEDHVT